MEHGLYEKTKKKINSDYANLDPTIYEALTNPKYEFPDPKEGDKTWSDWREEMQLREEEEKCREERTAILTDFEVLRSKVKKLLDANEASPEIEKLPIAVFDLDIAGRDQKLKAGRDVCESLHLELEHNISEMTRVSKWIRETFWDPQEVEGKSLFAILGTIEVTNYPTVAEEQDAKDHLKCAIFCKKTAYGILENDVFDPWRVYTAEQLEMEISKKQKVFREDDRRIDKLLDADDADDDDDLHDDDEDMNKKEQEEKEIAEIDMEERRAMEGKGRFSGNVTLNLKSI